MASLSEASDLQPTQNLAPVQDTLQALKNVMENQWKNLISSISLWTVYKLARYWIIGALLYNLYWCASYDSALSGIKSVWSSFNRAQSVVNNGWYLKSWPKQRQEEDYK